jgi:hypothetical protein
MSKALEATCEGGVVTAEGVSVDEPEIMSEGEGSSVGVLLQDQEKTWYFAKITPDLKSTLEKISSALGQIASALSSIDAKPTGGSGSAPAPAAAGNISAINTVKAEVDALKDNLR